MMVPRMGKVFAIKGERERKKKTTFQQQTEYEFMIKGANFYLTLVFAKSFNSSLFLLASKMGKKSSRVEKLEHPLSNVVTSLWSCHNILSKLKKCHRQMLLGPKRELYTRYVRSQ
jgi:hypothetical protein